MITKEIADIYQSDIELLEAIETVTGGFFGHEPGTCGNPTCDGSTPENCCDPAVTLWLNGGLEEEINAELDHLLPMWRKKQVWWGNEVYTGDAT